MVRDIHWHLLLTDKILKKPMIAPVETLSADDVCVRCKVRRSLSSSTHDFGPMLDMTCTMRNWSSEGPVKLSNGVKPKQLDRFVENIRHLVVDPRENGPELLLRPILAQQIPVNALINRDRFNSFGQVPSLTKNNKHNCRSDNDNSEGGQSFYSIRTSSDLSISSRKKNIGVRRHRDNGFSSASYDKENKDLNPCFAQYYQSYTIPMRDITVADVDTTNSSIYGSIEAKRKKSQVLYVHVTTINHEYFEFYFDSQNSYDIFMAFLQSSLSRERLCCKSSDSQSSDRLNLSRLSHSWCSERSFDIERFEEREVKEAVDGEQNTERVRRNIVILVSRFSEAVTDCMSCSCIEYQQSRFVNDAEGEKDFDSVISNDIKLTPQNTSPEMLTSAMKSRSANVETVDVLCTAREEKN